MDKKKNKEVAIKEAPKERIVYTSEEINKEDYGSPLVQLYKEAVMNRQTYDDLINSIVNEMEDPKFRLRMAIVLAKLLHDGGAII